MNNFANNFNPINDNGVYGNINYMNQDQNQIQYQNQNQNMMNKVVPC